MRREATEYRTASSLVTFSEGHINNRCRCALIARIDAARACPDGSQGRAVREDVDHKIEKLQEPPPGQSVKALPVPAEGPKKRRGGRRARKQKERLQMTEVRKQQNRMAFGVAEEEIGHQFGSTKGLGMAGKGGVPGKIRAVVADKKNKSTCFYLDCVFVLDDFTLFWHVPLPVFILTTKLAL